MINQGYESDTDAIRVCQQGREHARIEFNPVPASQLGAGEQIDWVWYG